LKYDFAEFISRAGKPNPTLMNAFSLTGAKVLLKDYNRSTMTLMHIPKAFH